MYQNYHRHTYVSNIVLTDSIASNEDYCKRAKELGHAIISSCEHGTQGRYRECYDLAKKYGLKWRYVCEAYFVKDRFEKDSTNCHIILAAKTSKGVGDLNEVLTEANISGYYYRPRVDLELLMGLDPKDVFVTTACIGGVWQYGCITNETLVDYTDEEGNIKKKKKKVFDHYEFAEPDRIVKLLHNHFGDSFMLEVQNHNTEKQKILNRHILSLYRENGINLIAGMDSHYIYPEDAELRKMRLEANGLFYEDEDGWFMDYPSDEVAYQRFIEQDVLPPQVISESLDNTNVFLTFEDVEFDKSKKLPNIYPELNQDQRNEKYRQLIRDAWRKYREKVPQEEWPKYLQEIKYEVDTITSTNTSDYFLLDYEWIKHAKEIGGILTKTGRGCFTEESYVTTTKGLKSIKDVCVGDTVVDINGEYKTVTNTYCYDVDEELVRIEANGNSMFGKSPVCTKDHKILVNRNGVVDWLEASLIQKGDRVCCPIIKEGKDEKRIVDLNKYNIFGFKYDEEYIYEPIGGKANSFIDTFSAAKHYGISQPALYNFVSGRTPCNNKKRGKMLFSIKQKIVKDYGCDSVEELISKYKDASVKKISRFVSLDDTFYTFIGMMYGDGNVRDNSFSLAINTKNHKNTYNRAVFVEMANKLCIDVYEYKNKHKDLSQLTCRTKVFSNFLSTEYFKSKKGKLKSFPESLLYLSAKSSKCILDGLFKTDGCDSDIRFSFDNTSLDLINAYRILSLKAGFCASSIIVREEHEDKRGFRSKRSYKLRYPNYKTELYLSKKQICDRKYWYLPVQNVTVIPKSKTKVYDIEVDGSHSFLLNNMIVHNSAPSYLTNMLLGFTSIDRVNCPIQLFPDRFISAERLKSGSMPDIDSNIANPDVFAKAQEDILGEWHSAPMVAFGTLKRASAWKMYCRASNVPYDIANEMTEYLKKYEMDCKYADEDERDEIDVHAYVPEKYWGVLDQSEKYMGIIDSISPHPCAYLLTSSDIRREIGLFRINSGAGEKKKAVLTAFIDGATADAYGYLKNDLLKVVVVELIADIYNRIGIPQPTVPELMKMVENDKKTWEMYAKGYTMGLNQAEREASTAKVMRYKPKNVSELSAYVAGIRPGAISIADKLFNRERFSYGIPALDTLLQTEQMKDSFVLYQEQVMAVLQWAGFEPSESYAAIKAIAKKHPEKVLPLKERFLNGFTHRLINEQNVEESFAKESADKVWKIVEDNTGYSFNACVVGETVIKQPGMYKPRNIRQMFYTMKRGSYAIDPKQYAAHKRYMEKGYGNGYSLGEDLTVSQNGIVGIYYSGIAETYTVETAGGRRITCTDNHKFPIGRFDNLVKLKDIHCGDKLFVMGEKQSQNDAYPSFQDEIVSITYSGKQRVYDVEMESPNHNFVIDNGLVIGNSHSLAVSLDSLYVAWAKAHYPLETYAALLSCYSAKGDKDKIAKTKLEMKKCAGIKVVPCKFRQDNRSYYIDKKNNSISDAISSVKCITPRVANALYQMRDRQYEYFTDLLFDMKMNNTAFNNTSISILIQMDYFSEFGGKGKLLDILREYNEGSSRVYKNLIRSSIEKRLEDLRCFESLAEDHEVEPVDQLLFETEYYGVPLSVFSDQKNIYSVLECDTKYSPKVKLYCAENGHVGTMKIKKSLYQSDPFKSGQIIEINAWSKKQAYSYQNGKAIPKEGEFDLWIDLYNVITKE